MVEHDMGVVFDLADKISVLVDGYIITVIPKNIKDNKSVQEVYLGKEKIILLEVKILHSYYDKSHISKVLI